MVNTLSIGQRLSKARHALDKKRSTIAQELNIRESYLEAIESDDYTKLPGKAYVSGFIKSYAEYLQLDAEDILKMLRATQDLQENYENMPQQLYKDYKRTKNICLLGFSSVLLLVVSFNYYNYVDHQINVRKIEDKASSEETLTSFYNQTQKKQTPEIVTAEEKTNKTDKVNEKTAVKEDEISLYGQKSKPPFARVLVKAKKDVWIQVRPLHKNRVYVSKTIPANKYYWITPWENVVLDVSDASSLEIIIDDKNMGKVGPNSKKVRGLFLDVESLNTYFEKQENENSEAIENYYKPVEKEQADKTV